MYEGKTALRVANKEGSPSAVKLLLESAIVNGIPPGKFMFDQSKMRRYLYECFENRKERRGATRIKSNGAIKFFLLMQNAESSRY